MKSFHGLFILFLALLFVSSCTIYEKLFDNPVDFEANEERGIGAPTLVFYPKTQTIAEGDPALVGSFIVFKEDSTKPFAGIHLQIEFPNALLELDTIKPGLFITDTSNATPLFTYTFDSINTIDIYAYFLDTLKKDLEGTGHLADLVFSPVGSGNDSIFYNLDECEIIDHQDAQIDINGERGAEIVVQ
jgi:hypothetical protein